MEQLNASTVRHRLSLGEDYLSWLNALEAAGAPPRPLSLPTPGELPALLVRLGVQPPDADAIIESCPSQTRTPEVWWLLERCSHRIVLDLGGFESLGRLPSLPPSLGALGRLFYAYVFLAALGDVRQWHHEHGIPDDISWATLADFGRNMAIYRRMFGVPGLDVQDWLTLHLRGVIYQLGRLQFNRSRIWYDAATLERLGVGLRHGEPALGVHIPETGPLLPEACDESFRQARAFFSRYFPSDSYRVATCTSWLLDDQLAEYLPPDANIVRFQRRFRLLPGGTEDDAAVFKFVFRRVAPALDELPQRTTLERAVVSHLKAGHHWRSRTGWLEL